MVGAGPGVGVGDGVEVEVGVGVGVALELLTLTVSNADPTMAPLVPKAVAEIECEPLEAVLEFHVLLNGGPEVQKFPSMYKSVHDTPELTAVATVTKLETVAPLAGAVIEAELVLPLLTVTLTDDDPIVVPLLPKAAAEITWLPLETVFEFQVVLNGGPEVQKFPSMYKSVQYTVELTAVATVTEPDTDTPFPGAVMFTTVSAAAVAPYANSASTAATIPNSWTDLDPQKRL